MEIGDEFFNEDRPETFVEDCEAIVGFFQRFMPSGIVLERRKIAGYETLAW